MTDITFYKLDAAFASLKEFDRCSKPDEFLEISLWHNREGFDAHLSSHGGQFFHLTWGQFKALKKLVEGLDQ